MKTIRQITLGFELSNKRIGFTMVYGFCVCVHLFELILRSITSRQICGNKPDEDFS